MASCGDGPDEAKLRLYCEGSVAHYDWLVAQGVPFKPVFYYGCSGEPPTDDGLGLVGLRARASRSARSRRRRRAVTCRKWSTRRDRS